MPSSLPNPSERTESRTKSSTNLNKIHVYLNITRKYFLANIPTINSRSGKESTTETGEVDAIQWSAFISFNRNSKKGKTF